MAFRRPRAFTKLLMRWGLSSPSPPPPPPPPPKPSVSLARHCATQTAPPKTTAKRLNHVAIAVPDLNSAAERWRQLAGAAAVSSPQAVPAHGVNVVFVTLSNVKIELLGVLGDKSPIASFLDKNKRGGMHHMCLEVDDAAAALAGVRARGQRTLTEVPTPGAHGTPVGFLHPADFDGCLLEVEEVKGGD